LFGHFPNEIIDFAAREFVMFFPVWQRQVEKGPEKEMYYVTV
jgi:hypothetical protein